MNLSSMLVHVIQVCKILHMQIMRYESLALR